MWVAQAEEMRVQGRFRVSTAERQEEKRKNCIGSSGVGGGSLTTWEFRDTGQERPESDHGPGHHTRSSALQRLPRQNQVAGFFMVEKIILFYKEWI